MFEIALTGSLEPKRLPAKIHHAEEAASFNDFIFTIGII
jgi:hypothetical protein